MRAPWTVHVVLYRIFRSNGAFDRDAMARSACERVFERYRNPACFYADKAIAMEGDWTSTKSLQEQAYEKHGKPEGEDGVHPLTKSLNHQESLCR